MSYIEKDRSGKYFNDASETIPINPASESRDDGTSTDENTLRWSWLIKGWANMTFKERLALFMPYLHYVNLQDYHRAEFDDQLQTDIVNKAYELCRMFIGKFKFFPDRQSTPNLMIEFDHIDIMAIPDENTRVAVLEWGVQMGVVKRKISDGEVSLIYSCCQ